MALFVRPPLHSPRAQLPPPPAAQSLDDWLRAPDVDPDAPGLVRPPPLASCASVRMSNAEFERFLCSLHLPARANRPCPSALAERATPTARTAGKAEAAAALGAPAGSGSDSGHAPGAEERGETEGSEQSGDGAREEGTDAAVLISASAAAGGEEEELPSAEGSEGGQSGGEEEEEGTDAGLLRVQAARDGARPASPPSAAYVEPAEEARGQGAWDEGPPPGLPPHFGAWLHGAFVAGRSELNPSALALLLPAKGSALLTSLCLAPFHSLRPAEAHRLAAWLAAHGSAAPFRELVAPPAAALCDRQVATAIARMASLRAMAVGALPAGEGGAPSAAWRAVASILFRGSPVSTLRLSHAALSLADARTVAHGVAASAVTELVLARCTNAAASDAAAVLAHSERPPRAVPAAVAAADDGLCAALVSALAPALQCARLATISLRGTRLGDAGTAVLCSLLAEAGSVQQLDVAHTALGADGAFALAAFVRGCASLRALDISMGPPLALPPMLALAEAVGAARALHTLRWACERPMAAVRHRLRMGAALARALRCSASLGSVCLAGQRMCLEVGEEEAAEAVEAEKGAATQREVEGTADAPAGAAEEEGGAGGEPAGAEGAPAGAEGAPAAAPAARDEALAVLRLQCALLPPEELIVGALATDVADGRRQVRLGLAWQRALSPGRPGLSSLDLRNACLRGEAVAALAAALCGCGNLATLDLSGNGVGGAAASLAELVRAHRTLATLRLASACVSGEGLRLLALALRHSRSLALLDLGANPLGGAWDEEAHAERGVAELAEALAHNGCLHTLLLPGCGLGHVPALPPPSQARLDAAEAAEAAEASATAALAAASQPESRPVAGKGAKAATGGGASAGKKGAPTPLADLAAAAAAASAAAARARLFLGPPVPCCELMLAGLGSNSRAALTSLDLAHNPLGDANAASLCRLLPAARSLRVLQLRGSLPASAVGPLAAAVEAQGAIALCDLHSANTADAIAEPQPHLGAPSAAAAASGEAGGARVSALLHSDADVYASTRGGGGRTGSDDGDEGAARDNDHSGGADASLRAALAVEEGLKEGRPLLRALWANRSTHGLGWERLLELFPPAMAERLRAAFALHTAAGRDGLQSASLVALLGSEAVRTLSPLAPDHLIPFGGFVQWVGDYLYGR